MNDKFWMIYVEGHSMPTKIHTELSEAVREAQRLARKEAGCGVYILETAYIHKFLPFATDIPCPCWLPLKVVKHRSVK